MAVSLVFFYSHMHVEAALALDATVTFSESDAKSSMRSSGLSRALTIQEQPADQELGSVEALTTLAVTNGPSTGALYSTLRVSWMPWVTESMDIAYVAIPNEARPLPSPVLAGSSSAAGRMRLLNPVRQGNTVRGLLQVRPTDSDAWGTVCDDVADSSRTTMNNICIMMGYAGIDTTMEDHSIASGSGTIWLDNVRCSSAGGTIFDCDHNGLGTHNCAHSEDLRPRCVRHDGDDAYDEGSTDTSGETGTSDSAW
jgi:deleted-in-malignant-brain-tumors protein 1